MRNTRKKRKAAAGALSAILAAALSLTAVPFSAFAAADKSAAAEDTSLLTVESTEGENPLYVEQHTYSDYYDVYSGSSRPDVEIMMPGAEYDSTEGGNFSVGSYGTEGDTKDNVLIWDSSEGKVNYKFTGAQSGVYCANRSYFPLETTATTIELSMLIDGESPYDTASRITLNKRWVNEKDIYVDSRGNQVRPSQIQSGAWMSTYLQDVDGLFNDPLIFYLEAGTHTLTLSGVKANIALEYIAFSQPEQAAPYGDSKPDASALSSTPPTMIRLEGEQADYKSDSTLYPTYDNSSYLASPSNPTKMVYNTIGSGNWKKALQTITWNINDKESNKLTGDGWYKIGIKARQQDMRGFYSNRRLLVDGKVQYEELNQIKFYYDTDWSVTSPKDASGDYIYVYLTADQVHTLTLEVVPGEIGDAMRRLDSIVLDLNTCYRKILMITGPDPDKYTDYNVHKKIPEILDEFQDLYDRLTTVQREIESLSGTEGSEAAALTRMTVILEKCMEKPIRIPDYMTQIKDNITAISAWMRDYRDQPLEVDYIELASADQQFSSVDEKFFSQLAFNWKAFIGSFTEDYTTLSDIDGESDEVLNVWVQLGRDQAQVVKQLAESDFMEKTGIPVSVNLVVGGIVEAALADKQPDVALFIGGEFPVNLAARGLLVDMSQFADYKETEGWFQKYATVQYQYEGGTYGLPISQNWPMLFYRKDILSELGFTAPPQTWQELIDMLPALQRNYMGVGLILPPANVSPATEAGHTYAMLTLQKGLNYYNDAQTRTTFDDIRAVQSFETWTEFYTKYEFEQTYDAFSRFRTGLYPIVVSNYTFFNQLEVASPEIKGLWDFTTVPGTLNEDGTISHASNSSGSAAIIFNSVANKENAWKFVRWFSSTETQVAYGMNIEGLLGQMGRFDAANTEALKQLSWSSEELAKLSAQRDELVEIPIIPASYAVTRNIMNAFRETVNNVEANPRDTLMKYNDDINDEITRKRENLGLE
ncbi:extracellular solute-binding protein [Ruminococcus champanellensis]|uniref:extracellular solute-binding protein n=1 Tax=Ruminococcus champanellensis TaxID=1161942 RepID=UPI00266D8605|nr:extracellular solute-binding protein [Ruminococcus champanellensis]